MKKRPRTKSSRTATQKAVKRIMKESVAEVLANTPKDAWTGLAKLWEEAGKQPAATPAAKKTAQPKP
jgi:hypothetical protein